MNALPSSIQNLEVESGCRKVGRLLSGFRRQTKRAPLLFVLTALLAAPHFTFAAGEVMNSAGSLPTNDLSALGSALKESPKGPASADCFQSLTPIDRQFVGTLADKLIKACPAESSQTCAEQAGAIWTSDLKYYERRYGKTALERVLTAINANLKRQQIASALRDFLDPRIAPSFKNFSAQLDRFNRDLSLATYQDIADNASLRRARRYLGMWTDGWSYSLTGGLTSGNRLKHLKDSQLALQKSTRALRTNIENSKLADKDKARLIGQVDLISNAVDDRIRHSRDEFMETNYALKLSGAAITSAALVAAGGTGLVYAFLRGASGGLGKMGAASASLLAMSTGSAGIGEISSIALQAKANAESKSTRFLCELARRTVVQGDAAINAVLEAGIGGAVLGAGIGGALHVATVLAPAAYASLIAATAGLAVGVPTAAGMIYDESGRWANSSWRERELLKMKKMVERGERTPGELIELQSAFAEGAAEDAAGRIEAAVVAGTLIPGGVHLARGIRAMPRSAKAGAAPPATAAQPDPQPSVLQRARKWTKDRGSKLAEKWNERRRNSPPA